MYFVHSGIIRFENPSWLAKSLAIHTVGETCMAGGLEGGSVVSRCFGDLCFSTFLDILEHIGNDQKKWSHLPIYGHIWQ